MPGFLKHIILLVYLISCSIRSYHYVIGSSCPAFTPFHSSSCIGHYVTFTMGVHFTTFSAPLTHNNQQQPGMHNNQGCTNTISVYSYGCLLSEPTNKPKTPLTHYYCSSAIVMWVPFRYGHIYRFVI